MEFSRCSLSANSIDIHQEIGSQQDKCTVLKLAYLLLVPLIFLQKKMDEAS